MERPKIAQFGEKGLLLSWADDINEAIHDQVLAYQKWIEGSFSSLIQETNIGYQSILILVKDEKDIAQLILDIEQSADHHFLNGLLQKYVYTIPVCYDANFGLDIEALAAEKQMSAQKLISLHTKPTYRVYFTGFLPGFLYLGGLDPALHAERLAEPKLNIPKGSVAIGGSQTGIYPQHSPGGWRIIGRTPLALFNKDKAPPVLCQPGDKIQFSAISATEFKAIETEIDADKFTIKKAILND